MGYLEEMNPDRILNTKGYGETIAKAYGIEKPQISEEEFKKREIGRILTESWARVNWNSKPLEQSKIQLPKQITKLEQLTESCEI